MRNLEVKARCQDLQQALARAQAFGAQKQWTKQQRDTYFKIPIGKLKLREVEGDIAELIVYHRPALPQARMSEYEIYYPSDPERLKKVLQAALGIDVIVEKKRTLLLWQNVRIHLDEVEQLGTFIELEAVVQKEEDLLPSSEHLSLLQRTLLIEPWQMIGEGYYELLKRFMM